MKTLEYLIKANSSDFVTAVTKAETIYGQALKGMADKAKQISLFKQAKDEADSTGTALVKLKTTAEQVRKALGDSGGSLQQSQQLAKAEAAISKTEAAMRGQVAAVVSMRQALAAAVSTPATWLPSRTRWPARLQKQSVIQNRRTNAAVMSWASELEPVTSAPRPTSSVKSAPRNPACIHAWPSCPGHQHGRAVRAATAPRPGLPSCAPSCRARCPPAAS
jgi:hypothetical protein